MGDPVQKTNEVYLRFQLLKLGVQVVLGSIGLLLKHNWGIGAK